jgi:hypothetical protein
MPNRYLLGTSDADRIISNGSATFILGGNGLDDINPGIVPPGQRSNVYGGVSLPDFGGTSCVQSAPTQCHPARGTAGQSGAIGGLGNDGNDFLHVGARVWAIPGSGRNTVQVHGPAPMTLRTTLGWKGEPEHPVAMMDFTTDRLIIDHSAGWAVVQVSKVGDVVTVVWIRALSVNPVVREQFIEVRFLDDGRGAHHPLVIPGGLSAVNDFFHASGFVQ